MGWQVLGKGETWPMLRWWSNLMTINTHVRHKLLGVGTKTPWMGYVGCEQAYGCSCPTRTTIISVNLLIRWHLHMEMRQVIISCKLTAVNNILLNPWFSLIPLKFNHNIFVRMWWLPYFTLNIPSSIHQHSHVDFDKEFISSNAFLIEE